MQLQRMADAQTPLKNNNISHLNGDIRYKTLFDNAYDAIFLMDFDTFVECNSKTAEIYGCGKETILGKTPYEFSPQIQSDGRNSKEKALEKINAALSGTPQRFEWVHKKCDGTLFDAEVSLNKITLGGKNYVQAIVRDITIEKRTRKALEDSESKYRALIENANEAIIVIQDDHLKLFNPMVPELLGYTEQELLHKPIAEFLHPDDRDLILKRLHSRFQGEKLPPLDKFRLTDKQGDTLWAQNSSVIIEWEGNPASLNFLINISKQHETEKEFNRQKKLSDRIINSAPNLIIALGKDSKILLFNEQAEKITGYTAEEVTGKRWVDLFIPEDQRFTLWDVFNKVVKDRYVEHHYENEIVTKSGEKRLIYWSNTVLTENDHFTMVLSIGEDVTEKRRAEQALVQNEKRWSQLFEAIPLGIHMYTLEKDGRLIFTGANKSANTILGLDNSQFIGKTIEEAFPLHKQTEIPARYREVASKGGIWRTEQFTYESGEIKGVFEVIAFQITSGRMVALFRDITEKKRFEDKLKSSEQRFRELADLLPQTIFEIDTSGRVTYTNKFGLDMFQYTQEEVEKGVSAFQLFITADQSRLKENIEKILGGEIQKDHEYTAVRKNGQQFPVLIYSGVITKDKKPIGVRGVLIDITTQKAAEEQLQEKVDELERTTRLMVGRELKMVELKEALHKVKGNSTAHETSSSISTD